MNNYINEIIDICKLPFDEISKDYKAIIIGGKCVYVSNYKKIIDYTMSKIVLKVFNGILEILGDEMKIQQINKKEIVICGKIMSLNQEVVNEKGNQK